MSESTGKTKGRRWVIKIGSSLLTNNGQGLAADAIDSWVAQMAAMQKAGDQVLLVSSGAVAEGMTRLGWKQRPHAIYELQAAAAVGQMGLIQAYESRFQQFGMHTAQTTEEIRFGDNDTLAAMVANLVEADALVFLTDQAGLYSSDPRKDASATLIPKAQAGDVSLEAMAQGGGGALGRGGMLTKLRAAARAAGSGTRTIIVSGKETDVLQRLAAGEALGTHLDPANVPLTARKQWLAGQLQVRGELTLDAGAAKVLCSSGSSLLAVGVTGVQGDFKRGDLVICNDPDGNEVARGLVNYDAAESGQIKGVSSDKIETVLGYVDEPELIHRDNLVLS